MAVKKIDKEFCLTDSTINCYGYRLLTSGLMLERFSPAIGYLMHDRDKGVAVRWENFRRDGDKLFAKPVVNVDLFPNLAEQIENGFYNAASLGHIVAIDLTDDPKEMLDGQTGPTVKKWFPRECSIVDIPGNFNALAQLFDESENVLHDLSAKSKSNLNKDVTMKDLQLNTDQLKGLNLSAEYTPDQFSSAITDLIAKANEGATYKKKYEDLQAESSKSQVEEILKKGMEDKKFGKDLCDKLRADYQTNPTGLKNLVDAMPKQQLITDELGDQTPTNLADKFKGKSYMDLYTSGDLQELKASHPEYFEYLKSKNQ